MSTGSFIGSYLRSDVSNVLSCTDCRETSAGPPERAVLGASARAPAQERMGAPLVEREPSLPRRSGRPHVLERAGRECFEHPRMHVRGPTDGGRVTEVGGDAFDRLLHNCSFLAFCLRWVDRAQG